MAHRMVVILLLLGLPVWLQNCAQVANPPGGKKDSLAPKLVESMPRMRQTNYSGKTIELTFDEYVKAENLQQKTTITPQDSNTYIVKPLPKGVRLTFARPFKPNTTYTINFSDGIRDITERNVATDSKLVFSTGPSLDSLSIAGNVVDDQTRKPIKEFVVGLFSPTDTLPINRKRPEYFARTDSSGNFRIENIRSDRYRLFGFQDTDQNLVNNTPGERIAFGDSIIDLKRTVTGQNMVAFSGYGKPRITRRERTDETLGLELNMGLANYQIKLPNAGDTLVSFLESPKMIRIFRPSNQTPTDTLAAVIVAEDSAGNRTDLRERIYFSPLKTRTRDRKPLTVTIKPNSGESIDRNLDITLTFSKPIRAFKQTLLVIGPDSTHPLTFEAADLTWRNHQSVLTIKKATTLRDSLLVRLEKGAVISIQGDTLPRFTARYTLAADDSYGLISGKVNRPGQQFIVELLDENYQVVRTAYDTPTYTFARLRPGRYRLRLILDTNGNHRRDVGNVQKGIQPETIIYHTGTDEDGTIRLKQDFELTDLDF